MIINCKCLKYQFDIPDHEITGEGRQVLCEFCNEEWFQENPNKELKHDDIETNNLEKEIPIPKINQENTIIKSKPSKNKKNKFSFLLLSFIILILTLYLGMIENKKLILENYPFFIGFFESSDIVKEIINQNINWIKEIIQSL